MEKDKDKLCETCMSIPATAFFSSEKPMTGSRFEFKLGPTVPYQLIEGPNAFEELKLSAAAGCGLCNLFQDSLETGGFHPDEELRKHPESCKDGIRLQRRSPDNLGLGIAFGKYCYRIHARPAILTDQSITRPIGCPLYLAETESNSPANFALARSWLAKCCKDHVECRDSLGCELPGRLLDVAIPSKPGIIRLISALDLPTNVRPDYAALSHCWGSFQPLQTKKENLSSHVQEIPGTRLPQTFLDAAQTTRELGLRYLWIDSLCIVQDDPTDFEAECARMNTIFANALCTISASDARDCRDGLFRSRTVKPILLTYESNSFQPKLTVTIEPEFSGFWRDGIRGPLQSRAWVLQERHLSPRVIHYTKKCLMWECRTAVASEHLPMMQAKAKVYGYVLDSNRFLDTGRPKLGHEDTGSGLRTDTFPTLYDRWYKIVEEYSRRALSHPEDRLPALSGFAAEWKRVKPEDEYFAGIWKSDIFKGLAWFPRSALRHAMRHLPEPAATWPPSSPFKGIPSWSWAAFNGPVAHFGGDWYKESYELSVLGVGQQLPPPTPRSLHLHNVTTTIEELNPFGRVSNGDITVSGWSIVVTLSESDFSPVSLSIIINALKVYGLHPEVKSIFDALVYFDHNPLSLPKTQF